VPRRRREFTLPISDPAASRRHLAEYLALVDRPVASLLARERLSQEGPGRFTYRSNPFRMLHLEVVPTLGLGARWQGGWLEVRSTNCQLIGLGGWEPSLDFRLEARLEPREGALGGWAEVGLVSKRGAMPGAGALMRWALDHVLDRIERRVMAGLHKDTVAWLAGKGAGGVA
jgi:hypothetical protein